MIDKVFKYFATAIFYLAIGWFFLGIIHFPDSPIRICGEEKYCGKGTIRSKSDYESFKVWEKSLIVTQPLAILLAFLAQSNPNLFSSLLDKLKRKRG
jgi:phosphoglucomutase